MDTDLESQPNALIEAKLSKISKSFSIENLIAKKSKAEVTNDDNGTNGNIVLPITFPQNFPFYNPWAANYLMSQTNLLPHNLLLPNNSHQQQQQPQHLQNDKLTNFMDLQQQQSGNFGFTELLFNPLASAAAIDQQSATYLQHDQLNINKIKDTNNFISEFYNNYFMSENNRLLMSATSDNAPTKRIKKQAVVDDSCNNSNDFDVVNDREEDSYSDLSVTMSPEHSQTHQQHAIDKGEFRQ